MISNLHKKLAAIQNPSTSTIQASKTKLELDFSCSVFENSYDKDYLIGDTPLGNIFDRNINSLLDVCFYKPDTNITLNDIVFFDTETTGLGSGTSTAAFLIGTGYFEGSKFITKQFLMNDYHQESDMIQSLNSILANCKAVVSYNGKAYDSHIVNSRSILNRLPRMLNDKIHLDLLHSARRLYKRRLDRCSMGNIEENILNLKRVDDIPGSEIPEIFFNYIKYKDDTLLNKVLEHNLQDIVSMVAIADTLLNAYNSPCTLTFKEDIYSQGLIFEKLDFPHKAKLCYNVLENYPSAKLRLGYISKSEGDYCAAIDYFSISSKMQKFDATADIELAKIYEHKIKDYNKAMEHTKIALEKTSLFLSSSSDNLIDEIKKRKLRLANKQSSIRKE